MTHTQTVFSAHYFAFLILFVIACLIYMFRKNRHQLYQQQLQIHREQIRRHHKLWEHIMRGGNVRL